MKKNTCSLLLLLLMLSMVVGGCGWVGRTAGQTKARIERQVEVVHGGVERQVEVLQKGYEAGYQEEQAKQNQQ